MVLANYVQDFPDATVTATETPLTAKYEGFTTDYSTVHGSGRIAFESAVREEPTEAPATTEAAPATTEAAAPETTEAPAAPAEAPKSNTGAIIAVIAAIVIVVVVIVVVKKKKAN